MSVSGSRETTNKKPKSRRQRPAKIVKAQAPKPTETVLRPFKDFYPSQLNPRKCYEKQALAELVKSIFDKGVLQSVVACETPQGLEIAAGSRRYLAVARLVQQGRVTPNFPLPVQIWELRDRELLDIATAENIARQDMHLLEEADAFAKLVDLGADAGSVAVQYGYTLKMVHPYHLTPEIGPGALRGG